MSQLRLSRFLPYRLNRVAAAASDRHARVYRAALGMTVPVWRVLATLGELESDAEMTATEIGRRTGMHKTKVSRAVADLAGRRFVERREDQGDRRFERVRLTSAGRRAYEQLVPDMLAAERALIGRLSAEDAASLERGLSALEAAFGFDGDRTPAEA